LSPVQEHDAQHDANVAFKVQGEPNSQAKRSHSKKSHSKKSHSKEKIQPKSEDSPEYFEQAKQEALATIE